MLELPLDMGKDDIEKTDMNDARTGDGNTVRSSAVENFFTPKTHNCARTHKQRISLGTYQQNNKLSDSNAYI